MVRRAELVATPFPDIAGDVVQPVTVGLVLVGGRRRRVPVGLRVALGELVLLNVTAVLAVGALFVALRVAFPPRPPRTAYSHFASVDRLLQAHSQYATASRHEMWTTECYMRSVTSELGPNGRDQ